MSISERKFSDLIGCIFLAFFLTVCEGHLFFQDGILGVGIDLSRIGLGKKDTCPSFDNVTCPCGNDGSSTLVAIKLCSYAHRLRIKCKPCKNLTFEEVCSRFINCYQCHADGQNSCATCPEGKFGVWCENDCRCVNGGICERDGTCTCSEGFNGKNCEKKRGCFPPEPINPPLQVVLTPPERPATAVYNCPQDYELKGQAISTCLSNNRWSSEPPRCLIRCPLLSAPINGRLTFSAKELVEGVTAEVLCSQNHRLIGPKAIVCLSNGQWNDDLPICETLASCPDPGNAPNAERVIQPGAVRLGGHFVQDSKIEYNCKAGFEQMGENIILCRFDGTWSNGLPTCVKVSTVVPDCSTPGSEIISDVGVPVRIFCPPECADEDFQVWGTSIYREKSSVCQAAIHSGKITNSGGPVAVINNGAYSHFTGSFSNNIESESYPSSDMSFRFEKLPRNVKSRDANDCEKGLVKLDHTCAYVSHPLRTRKEAEAICSNMGLQLDLPSDAEDNLKLVTLLTGKGINSIWAFRDSQAFPIPVSENSTENSTSFQCSAATVDYLELRMENRPCNEYLNYVCIAQPDAQSLAICSDPGPLINGKSEAVGQIDGIYYVGSSIEFSCQPLHFLRGEKTISCTARGNWSHPKPVCTKVDACQDPPIPIGGFLTYLPPLKTATAQRSAVYTSRVVGSRTARLPSGLAAPVPENLPTPTATKEPDTGPLPPGFHRKGTRAMYDCESRYYKLIGSRTRRCQDQGEWSGRPPTCIPICGRSDSRRSPFIVNGNATEMGQWPWQAGIARYLPDYNRWFLLCGAALLNERWVITAAHCVTYAGTILTIEPDKFQVYLGKYHRSDSKDDELVQVRKIHEIHIHPDYDPGLFDADIALLQLDSPVQLNSRVQPVCLPTEQTTGENLVEGKKGVVTGWGMNENETYSETLQQAVLPVVSRAKCEKGYEDSELPLTVTDNMFCAGYAIGKTDACSGDSGGPIVFTDDSSKERKWVLEGIVSWGSPQGCGNPNQYGGFTTVSRFLDWIHLYF